MNTETNARTGTMAGHKSAPRTALTAGGLTPTQEVDVIVNDTRPADTLPRFEAR